MDLSLEELRSRVAKIEESKYLLNPDFFPDFREAALTIGRLYMPANFVERVSGKKGTYSYGAVFDPHTDRNLDGNRGKWTARFVYWRKDMVMFHTGVDGKIIIEEPTLEPITFRFKYLHGFIPKKHVPNIQQSRDWWDKIAVRYYGKFLFALMFEEENLKYQQTQNVSSRSHH